MHVVSCIVHVQYGTDSRTLDNPTILDDCLPARTDFTLPTSDFFNLLDHVQPLDHFSKNDVFATSNPGQRGSPRTELIYEVEDRLVLKIEAEAMDVEKWRSGE